ncbi:O-phosphoseryl-tRna(Sec) selenium transferase [Cardiosporidium cionae]|uniref:O-phosphoseryl-tRNA(Sec) selenium transferase n=1 Tax=Cardiosporidium cionae TaxID=476202 RepID=A0ABQ7JB53_9APIC|nr:O-phosphoseryl-tRna(Sec) selenium transferase [Cardiosporidium cionae]|eukprot:KAF8821206.1 O-phosphoseryl-tRna(Sec) selenium transferase [Cardiosporidium cionae]
MLRKHLELTEQLIGQSYAHQVGQAINSRSKLLSNLLTHRSLPEEGWDEMSITLLLNEVALLDSNNFIGNVGVGEREGRVYSKMVQQRYFYLSHGTGRSGDIMALQPKAAGSSLISVLSHYLALDVLHACGLKSVTACCILPMATGMSLTMCMLSLRESRSEAKYVLWSRIDQKSCFKSILTAGFTPYVIELKRDGDQLCTDVEAIEETIKTLGPSSIVCVMTTTSTFAPRIPDAIIEVAKICSHQEIPHIINNAYGLQCFKCCHLVEQACRTGRVDFIVQSLDKNFMVPVGGALIASPEIKKIEKLSKMYPGRASANALIDLFITLLEMGHRGYLQLRRDRKELGIWFHNALENVVTKYGCRLLHCPNNKVSFAVNISPLLTHETITFKDLTMLGSLLYNHRCTGARVVLSYPEEMKISSSSKEENNKKQNSLDKMIGNHLFVNFGAHKIDYPFSYLTVACAIGVCLHFFSCFDLFFNRVDVKGGGLIGNAVINGETIRELRGVSKKELIIFLDRLDTAFQKFLKMFSSQKTKEAKSLAEDM